MMFFRIYGDNPRAQASGLSTLQADEPCPLSIVPWYPCVDLARYGYLMLKLLASGKCVTKSVTLLQLALKSV